MTSLSTIPSPPHPRLHRGEPHPVGRGWTGPGGARGAAVRGSKQPGKDPRSVQEVNTDGAEHHSERGSLGAHLMTPGGAERKYGPSLGKLSAENAWGVDEVEEVRVQEDLGPVPAEEPPPPSCGARPPCPR